MHLHIVNVALTRYIVRLIGQRMRSDHFVELYAAAVLGCGLVLHDKGKAEGKADCEGIQGAAAAGAACHRVGRVGGKQVRCAVFQRQFQGEWGPRNTLRLRWMVNCAFIGLSGVEHMRSHSDLYVIVPCKIDKVEAQLVQVLQQLLQALRS